MSKTQLADAVLKPIIKRKLKDLCEKAEHEFWVRDPDAWINDMVANIPVNVRIDSVYHDQKKYDGTDIYILTGYGTGICHHMNPVTDEALSKVAEDILKVEPWGCPWGSKPVEKPEPIHTVTHFDTNN